MIKKKQDKVGPRRVPETFSRQQQEPMAPHFGVKLKCKTHHQKDLYREIKNKEVILSTGDAGSGKSFVAIATSLELISDKDSPYEKLVILVPTVQIEDLGLLPGSVEEKTEPFTEAPRYTIEKILSMSGHNGKELLERLIKAGVIEIKCISFLRGMTYSNTIVILEESQNFGKEAFRVWLGRIGENCKYIAVGDASQIDVKALRRTPKDTGLQFAIDHIGLLDEVGVVQFDRSDIVRNPLITKLLDAWDGYLPEEKKEED